ncbi:GSCFA domain-containing protein [Dankookia sp. GCM10030260]|uniref:GSCFA domain-containing protein n=1 Tax=Dankookia sp. GCM10030260 TaxID=3273390 RepID=UPI003610E64C
MKNLGAFGAQELITHAPDGEVTKKIGSSFFRGEHCNFNPYLADHKAPDFIERFLLRGWMPEHRSIDRSTRLTAFGSCFATNITRHLSEIGYNVAKDRDPGIYISSMGEGLVNVHSLLGQFEWALEGVDPPQGLWHGYKAEEYGCNDSIREQTRRVMLDTDFFVVTLGLSEVWYDEQTGGVFWRAVPQQHYDPARHRFRVCSMMETKAALQRIHDIVRRRIPNAKLLFTLSPVPLAATFRPVSCITANSVSKAILRAALDEMLRDAGDHLNQDLYYWPSYEIANDLFLSRFGPDGRHPHKGIIDFIMKLFEAVHCKTEVGLEDLNRLYQEARAANLRTAAV